MYVQVGDPIDLSLQLFSGATDKFVRAWLYGLDDAVLNGGDPIVLAHVARGLYTDSSFLMPDTRVVKAQYEVYQDEDFTIPSDVDGPAMDFFKKDVVAPLVASLIEEIRAVASFVPAIEMEIDGDGQNRAGQKLVIYKGAKKAFDLRLKSSQTGNYLDLTPFVEIIARIPKGDDTMAEFKLTASQVAKLLPGSGLLRVTIEEDQSALLKAVEDGTLELELWYDADAPDRDPVIVQKEALLVIRNHASAFS